jgi:aromatic ring-cleaving dioxygenase
MQTSQFQYNEDINFGKKINSESWQFHRKLELEFPHLYQEWQRRFPFDSKECAGFELSLAFQKNCEHHGVPEGDRHNVFSQFCKKFWHLITEKKAHISKETFDEVLNFHIHYYESTIANLRGPHPQDMRTEVVNRLELKTKINELIESATMESPIFVHTVTGDDLYDHTYGAIWLGHRLGLDFSKLD